LEGVIHFHKNIPTVLNIDDILDLMNEDTFFISDWNKTEESLELPDNLFHPLKDNIMKNCNKYYFSDEFEEIKQKFKNTIFDVFNENVKIENFCVLNNGTTGLFLSFLVLKEMKCKNILVINPSYFTLIYVFENLDFNYSFLNIELIDSNLNHIDFNFLDNYINQNNIEVIVVTDPIFGMGISISNTLYENLINICSKNKTWLVIDYLYGGMEWNINNNIINRFFIKINKKHDKIILIESISKRLFLNGIKICLVYANNEIIKKIEKLSVSFSGSMTCVQTDTFCELYSFKNIYGINDLIHNFIVGIKQSYEQIQSIINGTDFFLSESNSGYFTLIGIPFHVLENFKCFEAAKLICSKTNVITIPHERYGLYSEYFYTFRVNLALRKDFLYSFISKLIKNF
jgi:aspartate/methionine/tyrosine aminotransferase